MKIPRRIAQTLINSLKGGVVPRVGLQYVTVGRTQEIDALLRDVEIITDGGASFRFIMGKYGSGKPVIGFLGEYDALSSLSQKADCPEKCASATRHGLIF